MILGEKIILLRKKAGWSQEELGEKLGVSRQAVSKWEGSQSIPDLDKILLLSQLFGVSIDYLVKDEMNPDEVEYTNETVQERLPNVSLEDANRFLEDTARIAKEMAISVSVCVLSPVMLLILGVLSEYKVIPLSEDMAGGIGVAILLLILIGPVAVFIRDGMKLDGYKLFEEQDFHAEYGVESIARDKKEKYAPIFARNIAAGVILCIAGVIPLMLCAGFGMSDIVMVFCVVLLLVLISIAVYLFVSSGMIHESYEKLLQEGDYTSEAKKRSKKVDAVAGVYWCTIVAIYLGVSFYKGNWDVSWIIWPSAGVLFAAIVCAMNLFNKKGSE